MKSPQDPERSQPAARRVPLVVSGSPLRRTRSQVAHILRWVAAVMAVVILISAGGLWFAFRHYNSQIDRIDIPTIQGAPKPAKASNGSENFLLVGSDTREGGNAEGTGFVGGERSDTVILIHMYGKSKNVELISFPRDSWVEIPAYTNPKTKRTTPTHFNKLNSAFAVGGPALLIATIERLSKLRVDHYLEIDFLGFKGMVNKLGGVDVCLTKPAVDQFSGINLKAGNHHISGDVALAFVRQRHGLANGDIDRIARQQQFIGSLVNKVLSAGTLLDPFKLTGFLDVATSSLKVDQDLKAGKLKTLALRMRSYRSRGVLFTTVPVAKINGVRDGQSVVLLHDAKTAVMFNDLAKDIPPGTAKPTPKPTKSPTPKPSQVPASAVHVAVFNGSSVAGLGRTAAEDLARAGFTVVGPAANRGRSATTTKIYYGPTQAAAARTLQTAIPGSVLVEQSSLADTIELVVGSSYQPTASPTPTTSSPASPPPVKTAADNPCTR